jgi:hypothetical protein
VTLLESSDDGIARIATRVGYETVAAFSKVFLRRPFLMIINWLRVGKDWKVASEIILPVPPASAAKG